MSEIHPLIIYHKYVNYRDHHNDNLHFQPIDRVDVSKYIYHIPLIYEYDHFDEFILEGSPLETMTGIRAHRSFIKPSYSLFCRFDLLNPEQMQFVKVMEQIHKWAVYQSRNTK